MRGLAAPDDAAVFRLDDNLSLVATADFFAPVVDDAYEFGAIAAANALSDIYAMGGEPKLALNLAAFPKDWDASVNGEILRGGAEKVLEAGAVIAGGHSTYDDEPKYGLAVIGMVPTNSFYTNEGAQTGDILFLTKPLGTGVIATAIKRKKSDDLFIRSAVASMSRLNAGAAKLLRHSDTTAIHAVTDITGFSLAGHGHEMAELSGVTLQFDFDKLPKLDGAEACIDAGLVPGGTNRNKDYYGQWTTTASGLGEKEDALIFDPQTSGGLLISADATHADSVEQIFNESSEPIWRIGEVVEGTAGHIVVM